MAYDAELADRLMAVVAHEPHITTRRMFGGFAVMLRGNMLAGVIGDDLMVRVGADAHERLLGEPDAGPVEFTHRPAKGMLMVRGDSVLDDERLQQWVDWANEFVGSLPAK